METIARDIYLNKLISKKENGLIKVITGLRRCGKSFLLFNLFKEHLKAEGVGDSNIIEIAFDSFENKALRQAEACYSYLKKKISATGSLCYVLLDEVQMLDDFESVLNGIARAGNVDLYVTGSNAKFLSKDIITEFRGRGDEVHIYPLSFSEFMSAYSGSKYDGWNEYIMYGGLPLVMNFKTPEQKADFLKSIFEETYIADITGRCNVRNRAELEDIINILSSSIGSLTNPNKLSNTFKSVQKKTLTAPTIKKYIGYLCDSFLIDYAMRYDVRGKRYIDTPLKYYFTDIGLRNARINFRQMEETHILENVIFNELKFRGCNVDVGIVTVNGKGAEKGKKSGARRQLEIDFVCNRGSKRYYIQSALSLPDSAKLEQEVRPFAYTGDFFKKIVITKDAPAPWYTESGVLVMSVFDFLLNQDSLDI